MRRERKRGAVGWKKDTSESDGLGALVGDLPDSGSGKPLLGHQRVPAGSPSHPRTVVGWGLYWGIRENKGMAMLVFQFKFFIVWQNLIKFIEVEKGKSCGAGFVVLENHKGVWQKLLHMNLKDPYTVVLDPQQHLPKSSERQGLFIIPHVLFFQT